MGNWLFTTSEQQNYNNIIITLMTHGVDIDKKIIELYNPDHELSPRTIYPELLMHKMARLITHESGKHYFSELSKICKIFDDSHSIVVSKNGEMVPFSAIEFEKLITFLISNVGNQYDRFLAKFIVKNCKKIKQFHDTVVKNHVNIHSGLVKSELFISDATIASLVEKIKSPE